MNGNILRRLMIDIDSAQGASLKALAAILNIDIQGTEGEFAQTIMKQTLIDRGEKAIEAAGISIINPSSNAHRNRE